MESIAERVLRLPYLQACKEADQLCTDFSFYADRYAVWLFSDGSRLKADQARSHLFSITDIK